MFLPPQKVKSVLFLKDYLKFGSQTQKWLQDLCHQNNVGMPDDSHFQMFREKF